MTITVSDKNNVDKLLKVHKELMSSQLQIGIFGEGDSELMMIAYVNEFGWTIKVTDAMRGYLGATGLNLRRETTEINIPERSYIRGGFDANASKITEFANDQIRQVLEFKKTVKNALGAIGEYSAGQIRDYMTALKDPENHPYTVSHKESSNPLIGSGNLRQKITWKIRRASDG